MTDIWVLDLETTDLRGILGGDKVLEVGVARVNLEAGRVYPEFASLVNNELSESDLHCWAFENTTLRPEDITNAPHGAYWVARSLDLYFNGAPMTSYNRSFDFDKFLNQSPWRGEFRPGYAPCLKITYGDYFNGGQWAHAQEAYDDLCPDNPAGLENGVELHRALDDAIMEGWILLRMCEKCEDVRKMYACAYETCWGVEA